MNTATSDKKDLIMSNVIPFPNCRPLTKLEQRAILRARYFDDGNWSMKDGRPHIVLEAEIGMTSCRWVAVYRKRGGGFVWEGGDTDVRDGSDVVLWPSRKVYATWDEARRAAWTKAIREIERECDVNTWAVIQFDEYGRVIPTWDDGDGGDAA